jgi:hypothetical protein
MNETKALYRQLQHYFENDLFGLYRWRDVKHRQPEPVRIERDPRGRRINQRSFGRFVERVILDIDGYVLSLASPNEIEPPEPQFGEERAPPAHAVHLYDGDARPENLVLSGPNTSETWAKVTKLLRDNIEKGQSNGAGTNPNEQAAAAGR